MIRIMQEEGWVESGAELGAYFLQGLQNLVAKHPILKDVRGRGMLLGVELHPHDMFSVEVLYHALLERGFLVGYYPAGSVLRIDPALTIERESIDLFLNALDLILNELV